VDARGLLLRPVGPNKYSTLTKNLLSWTRFLAHGCQESGTVVPMDLLPTLAETIRAALDASPLTERQVEDVTNVPRTTLKRKLDKPETFTWAELDSIARFMGHDNAETFIAEVRGWAA
jgi:hypothetical protein